MPLRWAHWRLLIIASLGQFLGATITIILGIILPVLKIISHPEISPFRQSIIGASELIGIMIGSTIIGRLADRFGYLRLFHISPSIVLLFSIIIYFFDNEYIFIPAIFFIGIGIGGEYALDSSYISELMPVKWKQMMVGIAKSFAALGYIAASLFGYFFLKFSHDPFSWNKLIIIVCITSAIMILIRLNFRESPNWLMIQDRKDEALRCLKHLDRKSVV